MDSDCGSSRPRRTSDGAYCLIVAAIAVATRLALYDFEFFALHRFPNHDMSQGAGLFAANLHSVRLSGELAWWKANLLNGYAHYYQTFFSPLAPTPSHIVFILWVQLALVLDLIELRLSEYMHYLTVTYVILPWLAIAGFCWLVSLLVKHRLPVLFAGIVYALSGIGLWEGAWFYFQEPATLNLLLASSIAILQRPSRSRLFLFLAAALVQAASINYWTVYNLFFVVLFLGVYMALHPMQVRDAWAALWRGRLFAAWFAAIAIVWGGLLTSIMVEQGGRYVRSGEGEGYSAERVVRQAREHPTAQAVLGLVKRGEVWTASFNPMHRARYIGLLTFLLAVFAIFVRFPDRTIFWLSITALAVVWVSTAPAPLVWLWTRIPMMDRIRHLFYLYPHFLAQLVVLLAAIGFDRLVAWGRFMKLRLAAATFLLVVTMIDLGLYYRGASGLDSDFTSNVMWRPMQPMTPEKQAKLASPLPDHLDPSGGFEGGVRGHLPIITWMFPDNVYLRAREAVELALAGDRGRTALHFATTGAPIVFMPPETVFRASDNGPDGAFGFGSDVLILHEYRGRGVPLWRPERVSSTARHVDVPFRAETWTYNTFAFAIEAPADGWLYLRQLPDPAWRIYTDGTVVTPVRANFVGTAIPITAGSHRIRLDYRPVARSLYWWAAAALELTLVVFFGLALASRRTTERTRIRENENSPVTH